MLTGISISLFGKYIPVKGGDYYPAVIWAKFMIRIFLLPMKVKGLENLDPGKNYVFVANHQGAWEPIKSKEYRSCRQVPASP